jgi:hypothetical protein
MKRLRRAYPRHALVVTEFGAEGIPELAAVITARMSPPAWPSAL